jgi:CHAD domain-containing protein
MTNGLKPRTGGNGSLAPIAGEPKRPLQRKAPRQESWEWVKLRSLARRQIDKFLLLVPEVLRDEDRMAIHKIRVATRRVEQILVLLYPKPRPKYVRNLLRNAKHCRRILGEIRNCDVLMGIAEAAILRGDAANLSAWEAVREYLQGRRARKSPALFQKLSRIQFALPYVKLKGALDTDGVCFDMVPENEIAELGDNWGFKLVHRRIVLSLENRWRTFEIAVEDSRAHPDEPVIHGVRIATKKLRYLAEVMDKLGVVGSSEAYNWFRTLQRAIGEWHDLEVLEHVINTMMSHKNFRQRHSALTARIEKLILENREIKRKSEARFSEMTSKSAEYRETKKWISGLLQSLQTSPQAVNS